MAKRRKRKLPQPDAMMDMTPMIDVVFLLIIFFLLAGRITSELRSEQITVPPTQTAEEPPDFSQWEHYVIDVFGRAQSAGGSNTNVRPSLTIAFNGDRWRQEYSEGSDRNYEAYSRLRRELDRIYDHAEKRPDPNNAQLQIPMVILEIRADSEAEYRVVQEIMQVASDSIDPDNLMLPAEHGSRAEMKPFVHLLFTTRRPGE